MALDVSQSVPSKKRSILLVRAAFCVFAIIAASVFAPGSASAAAPHQTTVAKAAYHATTQAAPSGVTTGVMHPNASWYCSYSWNSRRVDSYCTVYSGYVELWGQCSNGGYYYAGWLPPGNWHSWVDCGGYFLWQFGFLTAG